MIMRWCLFFTSKNSIAKSETHESLELKDENEKEDKDSNFLELILKEILALH